MEIQIGSSRVLYCSPSEAIREEGSDIRLQNPFNTFTTWYDEACSHSQIQEPNAMCLSTVAPDDRPSSRYVLLKRYSQEAGFVFFTNYLSRKGCELAKNPFASLLFYWQPLKRSIRIEGLCQKIPDSESSKFFESRYFESQISTIVSRQSYPVQDRDTMERLYAEELARLAQRDLKPQRPKHWGGYRLIPDLFEFWQGQTNRFHDRFQFMKVGSYRSIAPTAEDLLPDVLNQDSADIQNETTDGKWTCERLFP